MKFRDAKRNKGFTDTNAEPSQGDDKLSSSTAMDEYFFDMLGSVADQQPLKKYDESAHFQKQEAERKASVVDHSEHSQRASKPKLKPKTKVVAKAQYIKPRFAELERGGISPLIIPAAFPKLAPVKAKPQEVPATAVKAKTSLEQKVADKVSITSAEKTKLKTSTKRATKLDRKTALAILEKKKSSLSVTQRARLEEKLGLKEKPVTTTQNDRKVKSTTSVAEVQALKQKELLASSVNEKVETKTEAHSEPELVSTALATEKLREKRSALVTPGEPGQAGPPSWAQDRFECLIFSVAGLKLAVPLVSLGAIYKIEKELTPIVGRADYFMGLYRYMDRNVSVVDTAQWVMPDRWNEQARDGYHFIIRLGGNNWGLACDSVHESIQLQAEMVKWRTERTSRAWLSGTVIGHMCALLDADVLSQMLEEKISSSGSAIS